MLEEPDQHHFPVGKHESVRRSLPQGRVDIELILQHTLIL